MRFDAIGCTQCLALHAVKTGFRHPMQATDATQVPLRTLITTQPTYRRYEKCIGYKQVESKYTQQTQLY